MFCQQHDVVCCTVCIAVKHRSCEGVEYIPNIARGLLQRQGKEKTKTSLEDLKADLKELKSKMENELKNLDQQRDGFIDDIQEFKKLIIVRVEELEKRSIKEVNSKHKAIADDINTYRKKIDVLLKVMDTRLDKLTQSTDNSDAQQFVDVKNGEKESREGTDLVKQAISRKTQIMKFEMNADIDVHLSKEQSLGHLKECAIVNIVCPVETGITKAFVSDLQENLKTYDVESEYKGLIGIIAGRYTIVVCEYYDLRELEHSITGIQDNTIILMTLYEYKAWYIRCITRRKRNFKSECTVSYRIEKKTPCSISFANERNTQTYKHVSNIVKGNSSSN